MSDNESEYYSDPESESTDSVIDIDETNKSKTPLVSSANNIETYDDSEIDDSESEKDDDESEIEEEEDEQIGGGADDVAYETEEESDDDNDDIEVDENAEIQTKKQTKNKKNTDLVIEDNDDDDDDEYENYLQKFDAEITKSYVNHFHPECIIHNYDEITKLTKIIRNDENIIVDPYHRTIPFLTKYEKARVLGQRSKQIETGAKPLVKVPENIIDGYIIAELELKEKKIPFIIKRPLPNGSCEYWNIRDLEIIGF